MSALTNSIAHELGQPLSAMIHNEQAPQMMVTANRAPSDTIGEIRSDIQAQGVQATQIIDRHRAMLQSRQLDMKPIGLHAAIVRTIVEAHGGTIAARNNPDGGATFIVTRLRSEASNIQ